MPTSGVFNGTNLVLSVEGTNLGHTTSCSLTLSTDLPEATTKDSSGFQEVIAGVIDNGYTGELSVLFANYGNSPIRIDKGDKIAQLVLIQTTTFDLVELEDIASRDGRGDNGFGSTGK